MLNTTIPSHDGKTFGAYLAKARVKAGGAAHAPVMVVIQEIFGVNEGLREICDTWARNGFHALCPDLFWRIEPGLQLHDNVEAEAQKAFALYDAFDVELGVKDLLSTLHHARSFDSAKVGAVGFCLGGKLAFMMAARSGVDCAISYYGVGLEEMLGDAAKIRHPLLMHIAEKDRFVDTAAQAKILAAVKENPRIEAHIYKGVDHAFARINGLYFNAEAAKLANARSLEFAKKNLL
jgi:carboxymethylenebutenolidase